MNPLKFATQRVIPALDLPLKVNIFLYLLMLIVQRQLEKFFTTLYSSL